MNEPTPTPESEQRSPAESDRSPGPLQCLLGALISGAIAIPLYWLSLSLIRGFAENPIPSSNPTAIGISVAVRTLVMGVSVLITGVFGLVAIGLVALAIQLLVQRSREGSAS